MGEDSNKVVKLVKGFEKKALKPKIVKILEKEKNWMKNMLAWIEMNLNFVGKWFELLKKSYIHFFVKKFSQSVTK